jgi:hypothetical protein
VLDIGLELLGRTLGMGMLLHARRPACKLLLDRGRSTPENLKNTPLVIDHDPDRQD